MSRANATTFTNEVGLKKNVLTIVLWREILLGFPFFATCAFRVPGGSELLRRSSVLLPLTASSSILSHAPDSGKQ